MRDQIDDLGAKLKAKEREFEQTLDPAKYTILRVDGHGFSKFTKSFEKPMDENIVRAMTLATSDWLKEFNGLSAFTQSDESTMVLDRVTNSEACLIFSGRVGKIATLSAGYYTSRFNFYLSERVPDCKTAYFDCRCFQVDDIKGVSDAFSWRQLDGFRNGVHSLAMSIASTKELQGKGTKEMLTLIEGKPEVSLKYKTTHLVHGTFVKKYQVEKEFVLNGVTTVAQPMLRNWYRI